MEFQVKFCSGKSDILLHMCYLQFALVFNFSLELIKKCTCFLPIRYKSFFQVHYYMSTKSLEIFKLVYHYLKVCIKMIMTIGYLKCTICSLEIKWTRSDLLRVFEFMPNKDVWFKFPLLLIKNLSLIITIKINFTSYFLIHELHICSVNEGCFIHQQTKLYFNFSCGWYDINSICVSFYSNLNRA